MIWITNALFFDKIALFYSRMSFIYFRNHEYLNIGGLEFRLPWWGMIGG